MIKVTKHCDLGRKTSLVRSSMAAPPLYGQIVPLYGMPDVTISLSTLM